MCERTNDTCRKFSALQSKVPAQFHCGKLGILFPTPGSVKKLVQVRDCGIVCVDWADE